MSSGPFPRRPPRLPFVFQGVRPFYFVTFNTHQRQPLLANDALHQAWLTFARQATDHGAAVGRYVLMPDHAHLFVWLAPRNGPRQLGARVEAVLGKELLRQGHPKPHWQEGFFDHMLRSDESYGEKWEYARQNPVRKGLCDRAVDWPYQGEVTELMW